MSETSKFTEDILAAAKEKAATLISEAEVETQKALEEAKSYIAKQGDEIIRTAKAEADAIKRRHVSEVRHRLKLKEQAERTRILSEVIEEARIRVAELTEDERTYMRFLAELIKTGIEELGLDSVIVHLNGRDLKRVETNRLEREIAKKLNRPVKIEWSKQPIDALGGAIISSADGRTRIVSTLDQRFNALEEKLLVEAGRILFSD